VAEVRALVEGVKGAEAALLRGDHAVAVGAPAVALDAYAEAVAGAPEDDPVHTLARVRRSAPPSLAPFRTPHEIDEDLARALAACERHGLLLILPEVHRAAGSVAIGRGDVAGARASLGRALQLAEAHGLLRLVGDLWNALGLAWYTESIARFTPRRRLRLWARGCATRGRATWRVMPSTVLPGVWLSDSVHDTASSAWFRGADGAGAGGAGERAQPAALGEE
jgi:hypothetical protein